jgi:hypothetical protein
MKIQSLFSSTDRSQSLFKRATSLVLTGVAALLFQAAVVQPAYAHSLSVTSATPGCNGSQIVINFTITSWDVGSTQMSGALGPHDGENGNVEVFFGGATSVASGAFVDPADSFSGQANAPLGTATVTVTATAEDSWGDGYGGGQTSAPVTVDLSTTSCGTTPPPGTGRFTGGGKVVVSNAIVPASGSVTVTKGFEVDCDMMPAHENLELNWEGNHFHMDRITSAVCTLQGNPPNPPKAPVNRIDATGTGSYNGTDGYTVVFTLWDQGEPGTNDEAGFVVCQTANPTSCSGSANIVLSVPLQLVSTGNIQAHVDQK